MNLADMLSSTATALAAGALVTFVAYSLLGHHLNRGRVSLSAALTYHDSEVSAVELARRAVPPPRTVWTSANNSYRIIQTFYAESVGTTSAVTALKDQVVVEQSYRDALDNIAWRREDPAVRFGNDDLPSDALRMMLIEFGNLVDVDSINV